MGVLARVVRVRDHAWRILQCGIGAAIAYAIGVHVLNHPQPVFAPIAAVVALGVSYGQRLRRVVEVVVGVALGVLIGDLLVSAAGSGTWQLALVVSLGMAAAVFLRAGTLMINQAAIQGVFVTVLLPTRSAGLARWEDAVTGGAVALVLAALVPASPLRRPLAMAAGLLSHVGDLLSEVGAAARADDPDRAQAALEHARDTQGRLDALRTAASDGLDVATLNPLRRRGAGSVREVAELAVPLDRAVRNVRVLARRMAVALERDEVLPPALLDLVDALASGALRLGEDVARRQGRRRSVEALTVVGRDSALVPRSSLSADVVLAQARSITVDLLEVAGLDADQARALVPIGGSIDTSTPMPPQRPEAG